MNLESLTLSGCPNLTLKGISQVAISCKNVLSLSFASCGDCISDDIVEIIASNMLYLNKINLSGCGKIGHSALSALATCRGLKHIDFSGCKRITDSAFIPLCEAIFHPGVQSLYLQLCYKITDVGLQWITNGFKTESGHLSILTLSLKGTK